MNKIISNLEYKLMSERLERFEQNLDKYHRGLITLEELESRLSDSLDHLESEEKQWFITTFMEVYGEQDNQR